MASLGELERAVMDLLWAGQEAATANTLRDLLAQSTRRPGRHRRPRRQGPGRHDGADRALPARAEGPRGARTRHPPAPLPGRLQPRRPHRGTDARGPRLRPRPRGRAGPLHWIRLRDVRRIPCANCWATANDRMFWTSYFLAVLAIVLAWPVPILLSRAQWPARSPFHGHAALAGHRPCRWPVHDRRHAGLRPGTGRGQPAWPASGPWPAWCSGTNPPRRWDSGTSSRSSAAALLTAHLVFTLLLTYYKIQRQRRRHRELLALLASPSGRRPRTMVISHDSPVAYCLPGGARSVTVLSDGLMAALEPAELRAVLIHENAHLSQRHHLLLWAFAAWRQALPWLPTTRLAQEAGQLADRDAGRRRRPQDRKQGHPDQGDRHRGQRLSRQSRRRVTRRHSASLASSGLDAAQPAPPAAPVRRR